MNCEQSEPKLPGNVVTVEGFCQKKWLLHYGIDYYFGESRTIPTVCSYGQWVHLEAHAQFPGECTAKRLGPKDSGRHGSTTMGSTWANGVYTTVFLDFFPMFRHTVQ